MERNQKINCTVTSCKYNQNAEHVCELEQILVAPVNDCNTKSPDESMCDSYEYNPNK